LVGAVVAECVLCPLNKVIGLTAGICFGIAGVA
jgi:hypothetical protein